MLRLFADHEVRSVMDLEGLWGFAFLGEVKADEVKVGGLVFGETMPVPMSFDAAPRYAGKRGLAAYRRVVELKEAGAYRLEFGAVHHWCRVFVDGKVVGEHANGFTRFGMDAGTLGAGRHEVVVLVDNRYDFDRAPLHLDYADWYHHGGISRGVELHKMPATWIEAARFTTLDWASRRVKVEVRYQSAVDAHLLLTVDVGGKRVVEEMVRTAKGAGTLVREVGLDGAEVWSPEKPVLHVAKVRLGEDDLIERIGIRQVEVEGRNILLNDKPLRLLGVNRHELHPQFGHAIPSAMMHADAQIVQAMHGNFVRGSHYPQDQKFLDYCDEMGLLVWNECTGWQYNEEHLANPRFVEALVKNTTEMVAASYNSPAVILWGVINESDSHKEKAVGG